MNRLGVRLEQGVPWHSGNYRLWIYSETRTGHGKNIHLNQANCGQMFLQIKPDKISSTVLISLSYSYSRSKTHFVACNTVDVLFILWQITLNTSGEARFWMLISPQTDCWKIDWKGSQKDLKENSISCLKYCKIFSSSVFWFSFSLVTFSLSECVFVLFSLLNKKSWKSCIWWQSSNHRRVLWKWLVIFVLWFERITPMKDAFG